MNVPSEPRRRNRGRMIQGFLLAFVVGVFAVPMIWFLGSGQSREDRMWGVAVGVIVNFVAILTIVASGA